MKILVVVDMQQDFVDGALGSPETRATVAPIVEKIKNFAGEIVSTLDTHDENYLQTQEGKNLPVIHTVKFTDGWRLNKEIEDALQVRLMENSTHPCVFKYTFGSDKLVDLIREINSREEVTEIEFVGTKTGICVVSNYVLVKTAFPEIPLKVDARCVSCVTPESNAHALEVLKLLQAEIVNEQ